MSNLSNAILEIYLPSLFPPSHHHHHQFKSLSLPPTLRNKQRMIKKKRRIHSRLTGISAAVIQGVVRLPFDSRRDRSRQGCKEQNGERTNAIASRLWRRAYVAPQVYTGAGIYPRRLYTVPAYFRLLGRT